MPRAVTPEGFAKHAAQRLAVHNATADGNTRGGIRAKLRELAKRLGVAPPTWALAVERRSAATARENRGGRKSRFGALGAPARPSASKRKACNPVEWSDALTALRLANPGSVVRVHNGGKVTIYAKVEGGRDTLEPRTFESVDAAVSAIEAA